MQPNPDGPVVETCNNNALFCALSFTWGPGNGSATVAGTSYPAGVTAHFKGFDDPSCLSAPSSSSGNLKVPIPPTLQAGGKGFLELGGMTMAAPITPVFDETSGPAFVPSTMSCMPGNARLTHTILNQQNGIRDIFAKELSVTLGTAAPTHGWVYGVFRDNLAMAYTATVTVKSVPAGMQTSDCTVAYTNEFRLNYQGVTAGVTFVDKTATDTHDAGLFGVICKLPSAGTSLDGEMITLGAVAAGADASSGIAFDDVTLPLAVSDTRATMIEWLPK